MKTTSAIIATPASRTASDDDYHPAGQPATVQVCLTFMREIKVWLQLTNVQVEVPIKSSRRQELLAYIATMAPDRNSRVSSGRILTDVFEHIAPRADVDNLRGLFQKHTQLLRKEINEAAQEAGFPKVKVFQYEKVDNSSTRWWLSEECRIIDLPTIRRLHEQIEGLEERGEEATEELEALCHHLVQVYQSYKGDYLETPLLHDEFGDADWVREPFTEYRDMYLQALWTEATSLHKASMQPDIADKERYQRAKRASLLYKIYALYAPKNRQFNLNARKSRRQSERALRGHLRLCRWLVDPQMADGTYSLYEQVMAREFPDWKPHPSTIEILRAIRSQSGTGLLMQDQIEPSEEQGNP